MIWGIGSIVIINNHLAYLRSAVHCLGSTAELWGAIQSSQLFVGTSAWHCNSTAELWGESGEGELGDQPMGHLGVGREGEGASNFGCPLL